MKKIFLMSAFALLSGFAFANEPGKTDTGIDYNAVELNYDGGTVDSTSLTGYSLAASYLLTENVFGTLSYRSFDVSSTTVTSTTLGGGYRVPLSSNTDGFGTAGYISSGDGSTTTTGYYIGGGVTAKLSDQIQLGGAYNYVYLDESVNQFTLNAKYLITNSIFANAGYSYQSGDSTVTTYSIGLGFKF